MLYHLNAVSPIFKMAVTGKCHSYIRELDPVPDDLYCKKCTLVARRLTITNCCGESFCQACIVNTQEKGKSCPVCAENNFTTFEHVKNQS